MLSDRKFTVACSPNAGEIVVFLKYNEQKMLLLGKKLWKTRICGSLIVRNDDSRDGSTVHTLRERIGINAEFFSKMFRFRPYQNGKVI